MPPARSSGRAPQAQSKQLRLRLAALLAAGCTASALVALYVWVRARKRKAREFKQRVQTAAAFRRHIQQKHRKRRQTTRRLRSHRKGAGKSYASVASEHQPQQEHHQDAQEDDVGESDSADSDAEDAPRVAVLGAGVSGLAAAYYIKKRRPEIDVHVFEREEFVGGNIQTVEALQPAMPVRIETGPRSLRTSTASAKFALQLIDDLGIGSQLAWANKATRGRRFVFDEKDRSLEELPTSLRQVLGFAFKHNLLPAVLRDISQAVFHADDGSGYDTCEAFFTRHFSAHLARRFLTALVHGIFSGEASKLLLRYAFPGMWQVEQAYGSIVLGAILDPFLKLSSAYEDPPMPPVPHMEPRVHKWVQRAAKERVASLKGGLTTLTTALWGRLTEAGVHLHMGTEVAALARARARTSTTSAIDTQVEDDAVVITPQTKQLPQQKQQQQEEEPRDVQAHGTMGVTPRSGPHVDVGDGGGGGGGSGHAQQGEDALGEDALGGVSLLDKVGAPLLVDVDCVISTLPPAALHSILEASLPHLALAEPAHRRALSCVHKLAQVRSLTIAVTTFVFLRTTFNSVVGSKVQPGFGFLMPRTRARGHLLGVVYDSCVFPDLAGQEHVVLTAMMGGEGEEHQRYVEEASERDLLDTAWAHIQDHLGVRCSPDASRLTRWVRAIPQFDSVYAAARSEVEACSRECLPWLFVGGKAFGYGVGVNDCIVTSAHMAEQVVDILS